MSKSVSKLAPIFAFKTNKCREIETKQMDTKLKRKKKKSPKTERRAKCTKKLKNISDDENEADVDRAECRRSLRLRNKTDDNCNAITYNEDSDDVTNDCDENVDQNNEAIVAVVDDNSNTVDYWVDAMCGQQSTDTDEDIQIVSCEDKASTPSPQEPEVVVTYEEQREYFLWTEKYKPINSLEVIGHKVAVNRLKSWLEDWTATPQTDDNSDEDSDADNALDDSNACLLICGPTGSGKTSMIHAIAEELKYEVLELNASMKRNGRIVSKILGEATQSHHMQKNKESSLTASNTIHSYFTSVANSQSNHQIPQKPIKKSKPKGILNYFTKQTNTLAENSANDNEIQEIEPKSCDNKSIEMDKNESISKSNDSLTIFSPKALSIATNSLILFDDIDVMIDEDLNGFWSAFNRIKSMTRKPVILTATQYVPYIEDCVNGLQILTLSKPDSVDCVNALKNICDKEFSDNHHELSENVSKYLSNSYGNDIRRCINELQFVSNDWQCVGQLEESQKSLVAKPDINSYYSSLILSDVLETNFKIVNDSQNRDDWMKCKPTFIEDNSQSAELAKDMINLMNELNDKLNRNNKFVNETKPLEQLTDYESIKTVSKYLSPNTRQPTVLLEYCPYISFICESESIRRSQSANHSRKSRRFMHHLDSCGLYIEDTIKSQLMSLFSSQTSFISKEDSSQTTENVSPAIDDDFYD